MLIYFFDSGEVFNLLVVSRNNIVLNPGVLEAAIAESNETKLNKSFFLAKSHKSLALFLTKVFRMGSL